MIKSVAKAMVEAIVEAISKLLRAKAKQSIFNPF